MVDKKERKQYPSASLPVAEAFVSEAKEWMETNLAAHVMWNDARATGTLAVAEYIANQHGYTLYSELSENPKVSEEDQNGNPG